MSELEEVLAGGNVSGRVVKIGATVRKASTFATDSVTAFLRHLHAMGFSGAPQCFGRDERGRQVLEFIPGHTAHREPPLSTIELGRLGRLIRQLHDVDASFDPGPHARWDVAITSDAETLICHNDLAPWNLIRDGERWIFIDWDGSGPGSREWDLAYAAQSFVPLAEGTDLDQQVVRLRALVHGYGPNRELSQKLPALLAERTRAMYELLIESAASGRQPWARLYAEGHGEYWRQAALHVEKNMGRWKRALETN